MYGLYIHIPFCRQKCNYCDFVSYSGKQDLVDVYLDALRMELNRYAGKPIISVYVGGGTPSLLSPGQIKELFKTIRKIFNCFHLSEITFEANPESLNDDVLGALKVAGVNRLSIGAQSFSEQNLKFLGRIHSASAAAKAVKAARKHHFSNISIDLIYGMPGQLPLEWQSDLKQAVSQNPEHISVYPLTIEQNTPMFAAGVTTDEDKQAELYEWAMDYLHSTGYEHYEISNWALTGYKCSHNLIYWNNKEYIGAGIAAASYFNGSRYKNCESIEEYIEKSKSGESAIAETEHIDDKIKMSEEMILKLRCSAGIEVSDDIISKFGETINRFIEQQLLERRDKRIRLTRRGLILANHVMREFV